MNRYESANKNESYENGYQESIKYRAIREIIKLKLGNLDGIENVHIEDILILLEKGIPRKKFIIVNKFNVEIMNKNVAVIF